MPVRTVLGDIAPADLGVCYAHEHIIIDPGYATEKFPAFQLDDTAKAAAELREFRAAGGRALVDSMPCDAGRNALKLAEVARAAEVHVLAPTGLHLAQYYPPNHWGERLDAQQLAALFIADIEEGIDANDYGGPELRRTKHRAGLIKIASGRDRLNERERKIFEAAAQAHCRTGAPILTHTEQGTAALEQVEVLRDFGCDLSHVVLSHTDRKPDPAYHREILSSGVKVEYDSAFRWKAGQGNPTRDLMVTLAGDGFLQQIMLGMDAARSSYWRAYGGSPGMDYLLTQFWPTLREAGLSGEDFETLFVRNPAEAYSFTEKQR